MKKMKKKWPADSRIVDAIITIFCSQSDVFDSEVTLTLKLQN